jgi:pimeloyl-ACP methyl ester carboxylesterase
VRGRPKLKIVDRDRAVVGLIGQMTVPTRGAAGAGEVMLLVHGAPEAYLAWSDAAIPRGARVLVVDVRGARTVGVVAWDGQSEAAVPFTP